MKWLLLMLVVVTESAAAHQRMTVTFRYRGEILYATFYSNVLGGQIDDLEDKQFSQWSKYLDQVRIQNYLGLSANDPVKRARYERGFFKKEKLSAHDEILVVHRKPMAGPGVDTNDPEVIGLLALDRLGHPFYDCLPGWNEPTYEQLLLDKRLAPLGLGVERPKPARWTQAALPAGVFRHWEPYVAARYFDVGRVYVGDVMQANALLAHEGIWPLIHALGNFYGLFSTGRLVPGRKTKVVGDVAIEGPAVLIPTMFVWEVFSTFTGGVRREGSRTRYYRQSGAEPLCVGEQCEWPDPWLGEDTRVQVVSKSGDAFRMGWPKRFAEQSRFSFVRDVTIVKTEYWRNETWDGKTYFTKFPGEVPIGHHPTEFASCVRAILGE